MFGRSKKSKVDGRWVRLVEPVERGDLRDPRVLLEYMEARRSEVLRSFGVFAPGLDSQDPAQVERSSGGMSLRLYDLVFVSYSAGDSIRDLRRIAGEAIRWNCDPVRELESLNMYQDFVRLAGVAQLLGLDDELVLLQEVLERIPVGERDLIIESLVLGKSTAATNDFRFGFKEFAQVLATSDRDAAATLLKEFVQKRWYQSHSGNSWHGSHIKEYYVGYWCFEGAGIAKILGFDALTWDIDYWPADLL